MCIHMYYEINLAMHMKYKCNIVRMLKYILHVLIAIGLFAARLRTRIVDMLRLLPDVRISMTAS